MILEGLLESKTLEEDLFKKEINQQDEEFLLDTTILNKGRLHHLKRYDQ